MRAILLGLMVLMLGAGCATMDKTLDEVNKGLDKAEATLDKVDTAVTNVAKTILSSS